MAKIIACKGHKIEILEKKVLTIGKIGDTINVAPRKREIEYSGIV